MGNQRSPSIPLLCTSAAWLVIAPAIGCAGCHGEFCYNSSYQSALKTTPFQVVYGVDPLAILSYHPDSARITAVDRQLQEQDVFLAEICDCLLLAQDTMKQHRQAPV